ncbi:chain-length determining protein [Brevundimonas sp.]|uniref:chain-length determining protein n=1 Tax=Brevundimonas sp. TaxID=1871086 RepID=UPI001A1D74C6|nr:chain-length determining protein [Brevundimonas sp.]MBJ7483588.1 chain-length determining protein [Brevundimonas sp.]
MTEPNLSYLGPIPKALSYDKPTPPWWRRIPLPFLIVVVLPTLIAAVYYLLIASPRYVSETQFVVRAANRSQPSSLGMALEGVGLSSTQTDAFTVHEYMTSRDAFKEVGRQVDLRRIVGPPGADALSRYPRPWEKGTEEGFYKGFQRFIVVGYDSSTGISTLRVEAYSPQDARRVAEVMLASGENLINRLNERSATDAVRDAQAARDRARQRLSEAQQQLVAFRNRERFIDPAETATESSRLIGGLMATVAQLRAERTQVMNEAANSPQLPVINSRIAAYESQISAERAKIAGDSGSLAPKLSAYEDLSLNREFADRELTAANAAVTSAEEDARRQKLYLDRIVAPSLPDEPAEPRRWIAILTLLISSLVAYGIGWFIWAGAREHRQE